MVPMTWIKPSEAMAMNYSRKAVEIVEFENIELNIAMVEFSIANIKHRKYERFMILRLEGFLLRLRYVVYQIIIVSLSQAAFFVAFLIFMIEAVHLILFLYYTFAYFYAKSWLMIASKVNIGVSIITISIIIFVISLTQPRRGEKYVDGAIQILALATFLLCIFFETVILLIKLTQLSYSGIRYLIQKFKDYKEKKRLNAIADKKKLFEEEKRKKLMALKGIKNSKYDDIDEDDPYCWVKNEEYSDESSSEMEEEEEQEAEEESSEEVDLGPIATESIDFFEGIKLKIDTKV